MNSLNNNFDTLMRLLMRDECATFDVVQHNTGLWMFVENLSHVETLKQFRYCDLTSVQKQCLQKLSETEEIIDKYVYQFLSEIEWDFVPTIQMVLPMRFNCMFEGIMYGDEWAFTQRLLMLAGDVEENPGPVNSRMQCAVDLELEEYFRQLSVSGGKGKRHTKKQSQFLQHANSFGGKQVLQHIEKMKSVLKRKEIDQKYVSQMNTEGVIKTAAYGIANYLLPGTGTAAATMIEGRKLLSISENMANVSENIAGVAETVKAQLPHIIDAHVDMTHVANSTLQTIRHVVEQFSNGMLSKMNHLFGEIGNVSTTTVAITILAIVACCKLSWKMASLSIMFVLAYFKWSDSVIAKVKSLLDIHVSQSLDTTTLAPFVPVLGQIVFTLIAFFGVTQIPSSRFYDSLLKRLDSIPKAVTGSSKIWEAAGACFERVSDEFKVYVLGVSREGLHEAHGTMKEIQEFVSKINEYMTPTQRLALAKDEKIVREVEAMYRQFSLWMHTSRWQSIPFEGQRILTATKPLINELYKTACQSSVHEGGARRAPLGVFFSGGTGVGKSELLRPLVGRILAARDPVSVQNIDNEVYTRCVETEFWDGYAGQRIVIVDDAFQIKDTVANPSMDYMEAIRLLNTAPCHVHCADLKDKGRFFTSEIVIYTTNLQREFKNFINSLNCKEAAIRRLGVLAFRVKPHPDFSILKDGSSKCDKIKVNQCGKCIAKFGGPLAFCPHAQLFDMYNIHDDVVTRPDLTYQEMLKVVVEHSEVQMKAEQRKLDLYDMLVKDPLMFDAEMDDNEDDFYDVDSDDEGEDNCENENYHNISTEYANYLHGRGLRDDELYAEMMVDPRMASAIITGHHWIIDTRVDSFDCEKFFRKHRLSRMRRHLISVFNDACAELSEQVEKIYQKCKAFNVLAILGLACTAVALLTTGIYLFGQGDKVPVAEQDIAHHIEASQSSAFVPKQNNVHQIEVSQSSAFIPKQQRVHQVESAHSSAYVPKGKLNYQVEGNMPGYLKWIESNREQLIHEIGQKQYDKFHSKAVIAANALEEVRQCPLTRAASEGFESEAFADQNCYSIMKKVMNNQLYALCSSTCVYGNVMFVRGCTLLVNRHFIRRFENLLALNKGQMLFLRNRHGKMCEIPMKHFVENAIPLVKGDLEIDACLVYLNPREAQCHPHPSIVSSFVTQEDLKMLTGKYGAILPSYAGSFPKEVEMVHKSLMDVSMSDNLFSVQEDQNIVQYNHSWEYTGFTENGDCGAPVILHAASSQRKIIGIHMAAQPLASTSHGLCQTVTQEMLMGAMQQIPKQFQGYVEIDVPLNDWEIEDLGNVPAGNGLCIHGITDKKVILPTKTKIVPSKIHQYVPSFTKPAMLHSFDGKNPMEIGLKKFGKQVPHIAPALIRPCVNDVQNNLEINRAKLERSEFARVLTYEEAVVGNGDEFIAPLNRGTSMGFPYVQNHLNARGKRTAFGDNEWTLDTILAKEIRDDVDLLRHKCQLGIQTNVYWSDTLKDERRPIEKVEAGKTRVFCAGPVHFTILFRQYFLGFAAWTMHNRNANEIATGTNVYDWDWNDIARKLTSRGFSKGKTNVIAGDFSNFDGSLNSQILWHILDAINDWYDDGEVNAQIRRTLWMHIAHAIHVNGNVVYQVTHSQPSGCPITAILNSIYNSIVIRIVFLLCAKQAEQDVTMKHFNELVACVSYGDDNLIAISESILQWFNQETITQAFLEIGHEYTDETKSGNVIPVRSLEEVAFLKRKFVWDPIANRYIAPLDLNTILEIAQWTKKGLGEDGITLANIDVTMRELSLHSQEIFDKYLDILKKACRQEGIDYRFLTYEEYRQMVLNIPFGYEGVEDFEVIVDPAMKLAKNYFIRRRNKLYVSKFELKLLKSKLDLYCAYRNRGWFSKAKELDELFSSTSRMSLSSPHKIQETKASGKIE